MFEHKENLELIELFKRLRVTDVRDGMDWMGYHHYGSVHPSFRPLYRPRASTIGIARTARYVPYEGPLPCLPPEEYREWVSMYYREISAGPWRSQLQQGDFMCIDLCGVHVGLIGSENSLGALNKGLRGFVFNGAGIRDTDEVIMQKIPVWSHFVSQSMVQCKIQFDAKNIPIAIGGTTIFPGDIIVADGDGVIVVPRKAAEDVAKYASRILNEDKIGRRNHYKALNWELDDTVARD